MFYVRLVRKSKKNGAKIAHKIRENSSLKGRESGAHLGSLFAKRHIKSER